MEKESFMDTAVARIMNENFVCIKVDREERPDIDNLYMYACKLITGGEGGWPLNAFALPEGKPFFAGTYYSNSSWKNLLIEISKAYREKRALIIKQAEALTKGIHDEAFSFDKADSTVTVGKNNYQKLFDSVYVQLDTANGGLKGDVKFPMPPVSEFLMSYYYWTGEKKAINAASTTLTKIALGGIYDQIGGGFSRYAVDPQWRIPHFEKMLYDNAQLISLYAHAHQLTQNDFYKKIVAETISFVERELASATGGYYSSLNADTENGEGEFYTWTERAFKSVVGDRHLLAEYYNVTSKGNWENRKNILSASFTPAAFCAQHQLSPLEFNSLLDSAKSRLLAERNKRTRPAIDTKVLTSWNAMLLKAYVDAFLATGEQDYLKNAFALANFIEKTMVSKDGALKRVLSEGRVSVNGFLDDYAWTSYAFMKLYQASFNKHWLDLSKLIADHAIAKFWDKGSKLFYYSAIQESSLVVNKFETADEGIPSSNAIMANVLYWLGIMYDRSQYVDMSLEMLHTVSGNMKTFPVYHAAWCGLAGLFANGSHEVAVMGKDAIARNIALQKRYLPDCIVMGGTDKEDLPLLESKLKENKTLIYVCTNKICRRPVEKVEEALGQIRERNFRK